MTKTQKLLEDCLFTAALATSSVFWFSLLSTPDRARRPVHERIFWCESCNAFRIQVVAICYTKFRDRGVRNVSIYRKCTGKRKNERFAGWCDASSQDDLYIRDAHALFKGDYM